MSIAAFRHFSQWYENTHRLSFSLSFRKCKNSFDLPLYFSLHSSFSSVSEIDGLFISQRCVLALVQCRNISPETVDRSKRSLIQMCMFRKTRLCDCKWSFIHHRFFFESSFFLDLRQMEYNNNDQSKYEAKKAKHTLRWYFSFSFSADQELWKRGVSHFYSNW